MAAVAHTVERIVILGAGGHARVIADAILKITQVNGRMKLVGFLDDDLCLSHKSILGHALLGAISSLSSIAHDAVVIGIGDNDTRRVLFKNLVAEGEKLVSVIHPGATIANDARIGMGTVVFAGVVVNAGCTVGENVILNTACTVDHDSTVGPHSHVCPGAHIGGTVTIGEGAYVGIGSSVIHGKRVGEWSTIGGGAAVIRDVLPLTTVVGVPARILTK